SLAWRVREDQRSSPAEPLMLRALALLLSIALAVPVYAEGFITRLLNKPVPGGVAVVDLGNGSVAPQVRYQGKPVLVIHEDGQRWIAILRSEEHPSELQ